MSFFQKKNRGPLVGVDLSPSSVKIVELSKKAKGGFCLDRYAVEPLEAGVIVDGAIQQLEPLADCLLRALQRTHTRTKEAALAMPTGAVIIKKIQLPAGLSETEYEFQVENEASQHIPFPLEEVNLDFQMIDKGPDQEGFVEVLLAASRKEKVDERVAVAEMAGLTPVAMDVELYAQRASLDYVTSWLPGGGAGQLIAVFSVGAFRTSLTVILDHQTIFEHEQPFGGQWLTDEMVRIYGCSAVEAEAWKRRGDVPENYWSELVPAFIAQGASNISRALQYFHTSTPYTHVDQVYLAGGAVSVAGFLEEITNILQVPVQVVDPFYGMDMSENINGKRLVGDAPSLVLASGLAMWRFSSDFT